MRAVEFIAAKRRGDTHARDQIEGFIQGAVGGEIPDYQVSAWLMAVCFQGLNRQETADLTAALVSSGSRLDWAQLKTVPVDKHSTGGVGDKTSLVVAPLAAACGLAVPMISGRGLGHTGGTLDKLESIPGFRTDLTVTEIRAAVESVGAVISGQTEEMAPGDRLLYALRDVTATVDCLGLIVSSILSKKIAEGASGLVLDVKVGSGAFMRHESDALRLARELVHTGQSMGIDTVALMTDMSQPLGRCVGNALEVAEAVEVLGGGGPPELRTLCVELTAYLLVVGRQVDSVETARELASEALQDGRARDRFAAMVERQGGDAAFIVDARRLPQATRRTELPAEQAGFVAAVHADRVGQAAMLLGAGRASAADRIDPAAGIEVLVRVGDRVEAGDPLAKLHYDEDSLLPGARERLRSAVELAEEARPAPRLIRKVISAQDTGWSDS